MDDLDLGPAGDIAPAAPLPTDAPETFSSEREAARAMSAARRAAEQPPPAESAKPATAEEPELAKADSGAPETEPAEQTEEAEPAEDLPPIDPPRSWTKEEKEAFASWPREAQESITRVASSREADFRRSQNEAAEARKAAQAEREQAEQARKQYEAQLPALMQELQNAQQSAFADIKTVQDVQKLAAEDPFRYLQWDAHQKQLAAVKFEADRAEQAKQAALQSEWAQHVQKENERAAELIPDLADKVKGPALTQRVATELLPDLGFADSELADLANGKTKLSIYDHRIQKLLADSLKLRDIQSAPKAVAPKNLPPVARPGTAPSARASSASKIQALQKEVDNSTGLAAIRASAALLRARRG